MMFSADALSGISISINIQTYVYTKQRCCFNLDNLHKRAKQPGIYLNKYHPNHTICYMHLLVCVENCFADYNKCNITQEVHFRMV